MILWYNKASKDALYVLVAPRAVALNRRATMSPIIPQKRCTQCKEFYPKTSQYFGKHSMGKDGLRAACKGCTNKSNAQYKHTEAGKLAELRYINGEAGRKTRDRALSKYSAKNPHKRHAKREVLNATRRGELTPISKCICQVCGSQAREYHHWSYEREHWLDVIPLCIPCHKKEHAK